MSRRFGRINGERSETIHATVLRLIRRNCWLGPALARDGLASCCDIKSSPGGALKVSPVANIGLVRLAC